METEKYVVLRSREISAPPRGDIDRAGPGYGFDVYAGQVVDMAAAGIVDSVGVLGMALHSAIASAALALTVDVLVHTRNPDLSFEP